MAIFPYHYYFFQNAVLDTHMRLDVSYQLESLHFFMLQNGTRPDFRAKALCKKQMSIYANYLPILAYFQVGDIPFLLPPESENILRVANRRLYRCVLTPGVHTGPNQGIARPKVRGA